MSNLLHGPISTNQILRIYPSYPWHFPTLIVFWLSTLMWPKAVLFSKLKFLVLFANLGFLTVFLIAWLLRWNKRTANWPKTAKKRSCISTESQNTVKLLKTMTSKILNIIYIDIGKLYKLGIIPSSGYFGIPRYILQVLLKKNNNREDHWSRPTRGYYMTKGLLVTRKRGGGGHWDDVFHHSLSMDIWDFPISLTDARLHDKGFRWRLHKARTDSRTRGMFTLSDKSE